MSVYGGLWMACVWYLFEIKDIIKSTMVGRASPMYSTNFFSMNGRSAERGGERRREERGERREEMGE